jgi:hypothetical protein
MPAVAVATRIGRRGFHVPNFVWERPGLQRKPEDLFSFASRAAVSTAAKFSADLGKRPPGASISS